MKRKALSLFTVVVALTHDGYIIDGPNLTEWDRQHKKYHVHTGVPRHPFASTPGYVGYITEKMFHSLCDNEIIVPAWPAPKKDSWGFEYCKYVLRTPPTAPIE